MKRLQTTRPLLRSRLAAGGSAVLALAIVVTIGWISAAASQQKARAEAIVQTQQQLSEQHLPGQIVVGYRVTTPEEHKQANLTRHNAALRHRYAHLNTDVMQVAPADEAATLQDLKTNADVLYAEPNFVRMSRGSMTPTDPAYAQQWGYKASVFDQAWGTTTGAGAPLIGQIDTGADLTHPDLADNVAPGGYDEINGDNNPADDNGHGTATFGIMAEATNNGLGGAGGCWSCKVMPIKVLDAQGSGGSAEVANGIMYAADHGVKIINASLGGPSSSSAEESAVAYAVSKGVLIIAAACEDRATNPDTDYPSSYPGVIGVGALAKTGTLETWSCYGSFVKIAAPSTTYTTAINGAYATFSGTSAAAPFVSAAAALLWAAHPLATRDQIAAALLAGSDACCTNINGGKLDVQKALDTLASLASPSPTPTPLATPTPAINKADLNHDGHVNVFDLSLILSKWGTADSTADINKDGTVSVFDLSMVLAAWNP